MPEARRRDLGPMNRDLTRLLIAVDQSDTPPASELIETFAGMCQDTRAALARWSDLLTHDVPRLNAMLARQQPYLNSQNGKVLPNYTLFGFWRNFAFIFTA